LGACRDSNFVELFYPVAIGAVVGRGAREQSGSPGEALRVCRYEQTEETDEGDPQPVLSRIHTTAKKKNLQQKSHAFRFFFYNVCIQNFRHTIYGKIKALHTAVHGCRF